jgi:Ca-activated chloride channel family protein
MSQFEFRDPLFLAIGLLAPLVYVLASRLSSVVLFSSLALFADAPPSLRARLLPLPPALLVLASLALAIALAGPRTGDHTTVVRREGIALVLVADRSGSMHARDFVSGDASIDRLQALKGVLRSFLGSDDQGWRRPDDLIGVVAFAGYADSICPLTLDHRNLSIILDDLEIVSDRSEDGTAVGEGLALAVERLREHPAKSKVVILLSDGVSNAGDISPTQAAELAAAHDIKVYTVGAGRTGYAAYPVQQRGGRVVLQQAYVELDERSLQEIAERTGGRYFHAEDVDALEEVYEEIDLLERTEISEQRYLQYTEHYAAFVWAALLLIGSAGLASQTLLRRLP